MKTGLQSNMKKRVVVIGAGPSGLVSAKELAKRGWNVEIYEALDRVGGMCRSFTWNSYSLDIGPHVFHTADRSLSDYWISEYGDLLVEGRYWSKNVKGDSFDELYDYPLSWESISTFPLDKKNKILKEVKSIGKTQKALATSYKEYMDALTGPTLRSMFFEKYPEKIWGIPIGNMTADWAPKRVNIYEKKTPFFDNQWTAIGTNGAGAIYERIAEEIEQLGGKVNLNSRITGIESSGSNISSILVDGKKVKIEAEDVVISTIPVVSLLSFLNVESSLQYRGVMIFYIDCLTDGVLPKDVSWLYYESDKVFFTRITEPKKMNLSMPSPKKTVITVEVPYTVDDMLDKKDRSALCDEIIDQVVMTGLITRDLVNDIKVVKEKYVYPVQYKGFQEELAKIKGLIGEYHQLYSLGAGAEFKYTDTQVLFKKAFDLVESLTEGKVLDRIKHNPVKFNRVIDTEHVSIGDGFPPYVIAEAGINHNGSLALGKQMIDAALGTGCDAIKFQTFLPNSRVSSKTKSSDFSEEADGIEESMFDMFSRLSMPFSEQKELFLYAKQKGVSIFSTPFDMESVDFLESIGVDLYKIASVDLVNLPLIRYVARTKKPIVLSTGMSSIGDIEDALDVIRQAGNPNVAILHCNSTYPARLEDMNISSIKTLKQCFNVPVGLSDHSFGLLASQVALSIGANVIERHFTLDCTMEGPDHILSSEPSEMRDLVVSAQKIPLILGNGVKNIKPSEYETFNFQRKSLYASQDIPCGEIITEEMISIKGPFGGILPKDMGNVIGRAAKFDIESDTPITWSSI